jgi:hypothetical protein
MGFWLLLAAEDEVRPVVELTTRSRVIALVLAVSFLVLVLELIRRHRLQERYTVFWFLLAVGMLVGAAVPDLLELIARLIGSRDTNIALFAMLMLILLALSFSATLSISSHSERITRLAQENALLKLRMEARHGDEEPVGSDAEDRDPGPS